MESTNLKEAIAGLNVLKKDAQADSYYGVDYLCKKRLCIEKAHTVNIVGVKFKNCFVLSAKDRRMIIPISV